MVVKSALTCTSLPIGRLLSVFRQPHDDAGAAVQFDEVAVPQPACDAGQRHDCRDAHLASDDGGMRQEAASLDQYSGSGGEEHDPSRVGAFSDENIAGVQRGVARIGDDTRPASHYTRTATESLEP